MPMQDSVEHDGFEKIPWKCTICGGNTDQCKCDPEEEAQAYADKLRFEKGER